jgi:transcriptional regulator with GAF, ATPase, and Fis domain
VVWQQAGQCTVAPEADALSTTLERLFAVALAQGQVWLSPRAPHPHERLLRPFAAQWGVPGLLVVPLPTLRRPLGLLLVGRAHPEAFSWQEVFLLHTLAGHLACTLEHCRLAQQQRQHTQALETLVDTRLAELGLAQEQYRQLAAETAALKTRLEEETIYLQEEIKSTHNFDELIGESRAMQKMLKAVEVVAPTESTVLLFGETGTGKELVARALHHRSLRRQRPLVKVNCAALPAGLIESELFGHEKGAFTGALARQVGRFELADGGTLFLDEIGDLPLELQAKLLRVLQEGEFERLGNARTIKVDVRIIAATNRDLEHAVREGRFRPDLYYRLQVFPIWLPPLRERRQDIPLLVRYFVTKYGAKLGTRITTIPHSTLEPLLTYAWPGNVRELEHVIERAVILSAGSQLRLGEWLPAPQTARPGARIMTLHELQRDHILAVLELTGWRVSGEQGAAQLLGLKPTTLEARMRKLGIRRRRDRTPFAPHSPKMLGPAHPSGRRIHADTIK